MNRNWLMLSVLRMDGTRGMIKSRYLGAYGADGTKCQYDYEHENPTIATWHFKLHRDEDAFMCDDHAAEILNNPNTRPYVQNN